MRALGFSYASPASAAREESQLSIDTLPLSARLLGAVFIVLYDMMISKI
jgi:hypothetical protein